MKDKKKQARNNTAWAHARQSRWCECGWLTGYIPIVVRRIHIYVNIRKYIDIVVVISMHQSLPVVEIDACRGDG